MEKELFLFSEENLLRQLEQAPYEFGCYKLRFYTLDGRLSNKATDTTADFFLYPSGGTLRDADFNIVFYSTRFDTYKGFVPPHLRENVSPE